MNLIKNRYSTGWLSIPCQGWIRGLSLSWFYRRVRTCFCQRY